MGKSTDRLRELLEAETYPLRYTHKFIGSNTPAFRAAVAELHRSFPEAVLENLRESGETRAYLSYTFVQTAKEACEVIAFVEATAVLVDLRIML